MKVFFDNWNPNSSSGPNGFGKKLYSSLEDIEDIKPFWVGNYLEKPDIQLSFIQSQVASGAPIVQRLDGIYFNSDQDYNAFNSQIQLTYNSAAAVIFQSNFNKQLIEAWFGEHENSHVIRNGTCLEEISKIPILENDLLDKYDNIWCCASSWRPHKRLSENIKYFMEFSGPNDCLIIAGENPDVSIANPKVFYAGHLDRPSLISLFNLIA